MSSGPSQMGVTAVIAAAGSGERLGAGGPKAFVPLGRRPMVEWSIEAFRAAGAAAIVVAVPPGHAHEPAGARAVVGGETRAQSVANAMAVVETELVAIHDAARPLVTPALIEAVVATLLADADAAGAIAATPVTDTIKRAGDVASSRLSSSEGPNRRLVVEQTLDRGELWAAQTPQAFRAAALREALSADRAAVAAATDEATLVEAAGGRVLIHPAPAENLKVTTPLDLELAEKLLR
jgi:2-C-methyl-D-erythritol 4-phosphate cytidylyltransferase